ncbi:hypothetical protein [Rhodoferax sp. UBA5149]|uniref:hypothetical protein n=1 Tax=Rhodoferax sp. UBA5149 TaxID=1947379 RepID=UPI0025D2F3AB|nr:hypothetical protein [Rhodoferax sp. UBA5149]
MRFESRILFVNPGFMRLLEHAFSRRQCLGFGGRFQRFKLLDRHNDGVNAPIFFHINRSNFGFGADGTEPVLGLGGGNSHGAAPGMVCWLF